LYCRACSFLNFGGIAGGLALVSKRVTNVVVAVDTKGRFAAGICRHHLMHSCGMAINARALGDAPVSRLDSDRFVKILECERQRVKKSIVGLGHPMADEVVGQMAIVASRDVLMAGVLPGIVVTLHDMAIRARLWVAAQIAGAFAIAKRE
jgi:hypothetical protein